MTLLATQFYTPSLDLVMLIIAVVVDVFLALFVYVSNTKSATNRIFFLLSFFTILWLIITYIVRLPEFSDVTLVLHRLGIFFAAPMSALFFLLAYTMPADTVPLSRRKLYLIVGATLLMMAVNVSPYAFVSVYWSDHSSQPQPGIGLIPFSILSTLFSILAVYWLIKKYRHSEGVVRKQLRLILVGTLMMLTLIIMTILIPILIFHSIRFLTLTPLYTIIFLGTTAYAVTKYQLFNTKVIATEALVGIIWIILFAKIFVDRSIAEKALDSFILALVVVFGVFLIRSVRREVEQREKLEVLSSELAQANERLEELDRLKSEFISMAGHQLRAPLTVIKGYTSLILEGTVGGATGKIKEVLEKVMFSAEQLIKLVSGLLDLSRIEAGKIKYDFTRGDLAKIAEEVIDKFRPNAGKKGLEIVFENKAGASTLTLDQDKIREAVVNYLDNAIKYSDKGRIGVTLERSGNNLRFAVKDVGLGIKAEDISKMFGKFHRTEEAQVKDPNGMGIGLYFVKRVVEDHGGKVGVYSGGVGKGSTFWMDLPMGNSIQKVGGGRGTGVPRGGNIKTEGF